MMEARTEQKSKGEKIVFSSGDLAEMLGVSKRTIEALLREGKIKGFKVGNVWRISRQEVEDLIIGRQKKTLF